MTIKELINANIDVNACDIWVEVFNSCDNERVYGGNALEYPYEDVNVWDYSMYNLEYMGCKVCIDIWADFPDWRPHTAEELEIIIENEVEDFLDLLYDDIFEDIVNEENTAIFGEDETFYLYNWEEPELF